MRKEDFFEVLGELDDDIVKGAKTPMKKKMNWKAWGTMAACLCLVVAAIAIPNTPTSTPATGSSTITGNNTEGGDQDIGMTSEELTSAMLDAGYTQAEVDEYQSLGYQMTWAKWWKFYHSIDNNGGDFTLDALKTFSQKELVINTGNMPGGAYVGDDNGASDDLKMSSQNKGMSGYNVGENPPTTVNADFIEQEK